MYTRNMILKAENNRELNVSWERWLNVCCEEKVKFGVNGFVLPRTIWRNI